MSDDHLVSVKWVSELKSRALDRMLVLCILGPLHSELIDEICNDPDVTPFNAIDLIEGEFIEASRIVAVRDLTPEKASRARTSLGKLREKSIELRDLGTSVIIISSAPKEVYPVVAGSNILEEAVASSINPPPRLIQEFREKRVQSVSGREGECEQIAKGLAGLGRDLVVSVEECLFEDDGYGDQLSQYFSAPEMRALRSLGLVGGPDGDEFFTLSKQITMDCVSRSFSHFSETPENAGQIYDDMWMIENLIRSSIRIKAMNSWGAGWRDSLINAGRQSKILELAQESAVPLARKFRDLRDPLEWLTLQELFELRLDKGLGDLGLPNPLWIRLRSEVSPVRNKVAHTRYLSKNDARVVRRWKLVLQQRLNNGA